MLVDSLYYKADFEHKKRIWNRGYFSYKIAKHARGGHSHEELDFAFAVILEYMQEYHVKLQDLPEILMNAVEVKCRVCFSSSERDGGCRFKLRVDIMNSPAKWDVVGITDTMSRAVKMLHFCILQDGKKYDWLGVIGFKASFVNENSEKWYCSEVCDTAKLQVQLWPNFYRSHPSESYWIQKYLSDAFTKLKGLRYSDLK